MTDGTILYRATAVGTNMTGSGYAVLERVREDPEDAVRSAVAVLSHKGGIDSDTVSIDDLERFVIDSRIDVTETDVPLHEDLSMAVTSGMVTERERVDPSEVSV